MKAKLVWMCARMAYKFLRPNIVTAVVDYERPDWTWDIIDLLDKLFRYNSTKVV